MDLLVPVLSYLIGSFPTAYLAAKLLTGKDLREFGSKNVGGLNLYRLLKKEKGKAIAVAVTVPVVLIDASKAIISFILASYLNASYIFLVTAPMFAIFGHNYPIWLGFKGGRGIAALLGYFLYKNPLTFVLFLLIQGVVLLFTRRFAPGAMLALLTALPLYHIFWGSLCPCQPLAEFPVWLRYREKYELMRKGELGVGY